MDHQRFDKSICIDKNDSLLDLDQNMILTLKNADGIEVRYRDENFDLYEEVLEGIVARMFQN